MAVTYIIRKKTERCGFYSTRSYHGKKALRHSCASGMLASGVSLKIVKDFLGHSDYRTTDKYYGHLEISDKAAALDTLSKSIKI
ncbi:MAG: tyrosine-type recombinase/integrase [Bacillota bacterium]|nr:tyrosine-type recombinase/integrase [Bacillota bacterium]